MHLESEAVVLAVLALESLQAGLREGHEGHTARPDLPGSGRVSAPANDI